MKDNMTINREDGTVVFNNASVPGGNWRNFSGLPTKFKPNNQERYFHIFLTDDEAQRLEDQGWNVKRTKHENPSEPQQAYLQVFIKLDVSARLQPRIWLTRKKGRPILMDADMIGQLDADDIERCKLQIRPYDWTLATGVSGRKAFVKQMFMTLIEDDFSAEFFNDDYDEDEVPFE